MGDLYIFSVPDDFKVNPGPVEAIAQHPSKPEKVSSFNKLSMEKC